MGPVVVAAGPERLQMEVASPELGKNPPVTADVAQFQTQPEHMPPKEMVELEKAESSKRVVAVEDLWLPLSAPEDRQQEGRSSFDPMVIEAADGRLPTLPHKAANPEVEEVAFDPMELEAAVVQRPSSNSANPEGKDLRLPRDTLAVVPTSTGSTGQPPQAEEGEGQVGGEVLGASSPMTDPTWSGTEFFATNETEPHQASNGPAHDNSGVILEDTRLSMAGPVLQVVQF